MKLFVSGIGVALSAFGIAQLNLNAAKPPVAKQVPYSFELHGNTIEDPYAWIKDKKNPETISYIKSENAYREAVMKPTLKFQDKLYKEIIGRIQEDDSDVPVYDNGYWYYGRTVKGKEYGLVCRKKGSLAAKEEILMDQNLAAKGQKFFSLGDSSVSPNNKLWAYTTDTTGFREYQLFIKDLSTGKVLKDRPGKVVGLTWASDNKSIYIVTEDAAKRWNKLWRYTIGSGKRELIYEEKDELFWVSISESTDDQYLFLSVGSKDTNEVRFFKLSDAKPQPKLIKPRGGTSQYAVDHREGTFYITSNDTGPNFRVATTPVSKYQPENWKTLIPTSDQNVISGISTYKNFMVISMREGGFTKLKLRDFKTGKTTSIPTADPIADIGGYPNPDYNTSSYTYNYTSLTTPASVYRYDLKSGKSKLLKQTKVKGGFKSSDYVSELEWATASDGTKVPISIVRKKTTKKSANTPLFLYAYGSYGAPTDPYFSVARLSMLNRGVIYAIAHIRGGGEFGRKWYEQGKMANKMNTFTDFIACGDHLVAKGYTSHNKMAMNGGSAGGLLMGAVLNLRPDLVKVAVADVPFVDVINTMLDESLPLTVGEFVEWGNPKVKEEFEWMRAYSPYDNVEAKNYPSILITTSLNDSQVLYHEPVKWTAKLRSLKTDSNPLLLKCNMDAGHGGASGRYSSLKELSETFAFVLTQLGITK
jgi:oligopeptidase B